MKKHEYLINGKPFVVEILSFDGRKADVRVNNIPYSVEVPQGPTGAAPAYAPPSPAAPPPAPAEAPRTAAPPSPPPARPVAAAAPQARASSDDLVVAPMPGIILSLTVKEGDPVNAGDVILVLEAMKMENEIRAPRTGTVKKIYVSEGAEVRAGAELIEFS